MKNMSLKRCAVLILTAVLGSQTVPLRAFNGWEWPDAESSRNGRVIEALILTANYVTPRRLAFLAQQETKAPVILLPAADSVDRNIYLFIPDGKDAVIIPPADLSKYISYINARKVIVIGGPDIVDPQWRAAIEAVYPVQDIASENQYLNAVMLSNSLQNPKILRRYQAILRKEQEKLKKQNEKKIEKKAVSAPAPIPEAVKDEVKLEPAAVPKTEKKAEVKITASQGPAPEKKAEVQNTKDTKSVKSSTSKK